MPRPLPTWTRPATAASVIARTTSTLSGARAEPTPGCVAKPDGDLLRRVHPPHPYGAFGHWDARPHAIERYNSYVRAARRQGARWEASDLPSTRSLRKCVASPALSPPALPASRPSDTKAPRTPVLSRACLRRTERHPRPGQPFHAEIHGLFTARSLIGAHSSVGALLTARSRCP